MTRQNAQEGPQIALGTINEPEGDYVVDVGPLRWASPFMEFAHPRIPAHRSAYDPKLWSLMSPHGVFIDERKRTHLCMGVVKGDDVVNWDTVRMAREPR